MNDHQERDLLAGLRYLGRKDKDGQMSVDSNLLVDWIVGSRSAIDRQGVSAALDRLEAAGRIKFDRRTNTIHVKAFGVED